MTYGTLADLRSRDCEFDSRSGRYQVVTTWTSDCLRTSKLSRYITNTKVNSAVHFSIIGKSNLAEVKAGRVHLCRVAGNVCNPIWHVTLRSSAMGFHVF